MIKPSTIHFSEYRHASCQRIFDGILINVISSVKKINTGTTVCSKTCVLHGRSLVNILNSPLYSQCKYMRSVCACACACDACVCLRVRVTRVE